MSIYRLLREETILLDNIDNIKKFNRELNKWDYGVLVNGKVYTKSSEIDWSKYKTIPIKDIEKYHVGICWDFVNYQHYYFKKNRINDESYFIVMAMSDNPNDIATHTFSIINIDGKKYWFESSWYKNQGVHEVKSWKDVVDKFKESYDKSGKRDYEVYKYNPDGLDQNISNEEFFKRTTKNMIYKFNVK